MHHEPTAYLPVPACKGYRQIFTMAAPRRAELVHQHNPGPGPEGGQRHGCLPAVGQGLETPAASAR